MFLSNSLIYTSINRIENHLDNYIYKGAETLKHKVTVLHTIRQP